MGWTRPGGGGGGGGLPTGCVATGQHAGQQLVAQPQLGPSTSSTIIRSLDDVLPAPPSVFSRVQASSPRRDSHPSSPSWRRRLPDRYRCLASHSCKQAVAAAGASTVKIVGEGCGQIQEGSGFVVAPGLVVTNAHVVAGIAHPTVQAGLLRDHDTTVVYFDPSSTWPCSGSPDSTEPALHLDPNRGPGRLRRPCSAIRRADRSRPVPAGVMADFEAEGRDIYGQGLTVRNVYEIQAVVRPGNSGGPLVLPDGEVIGVVFSRSTTNGDDRVRPTSPGRAVRGSTRPIGHRTGGDRGCTTG